ncbi:hypothetical protein PVAP13_8NG219102 [Panicum virgatum]|uniref:Uncharacterized protein n=1 Tax=Panicum virgatum TaxID=38727 RepID=A0A8T0P7R6_PANVG|nr:hypothetical protein PVAP13_8NG219102 [Panicum virgatum]
MPPLPSPLRSPLTGSEEQWRGEERRRLTGTARRALRELRLELRQRWRTARRELRQRPWTVRREVRQRRPLLLLLRRGVAAPTPSPNPARGPLPLLPRIRREAPPSPSPNPARGSSLSFPGSGAQPWTLLPQRVAAPSPLGVAARPDPATSYFGARRRRWRGRWLQRRRRLQRLTVVAVVAVCWWRRRAAASRSMPT